MIHATIGVICQYLKRVGIALSVLLNVLLGGCSNQTFSARNYHWNRNKRPNIHKAIDYVLGQDHCFMSWVFWETRKK